MSHFDQNGNDEEKHTVEQTFKTIPNLRVFFLLNKMYPSKYNLENFLRENVRSVERLSGYMNDLIRAKYIFDVFKYAEEIWDGFDGYMKISISRFSPYIQEQYIEYLYKTDKKELAKTIINETLNDIYLHPELFLIIVKNKLRGSWGGDKEISVVRLFEKLFELYEFISIEANNEEQKEVKQLYQQLMQKTRDMIRANNYSNFKKMVDEIDNINRAEMLLRQIERIENIAVEMQTELKSLIADKFREIEKEREEKTEIFFTLKTSLDEKIKRYKYIQGVEIPENSERIGEASAMGDLSENAEYKAAKEKQKMLQNTLRNLGDEIDKAEIMDFSKISGDFATFGTKVKLQDKEGNEYVYSILGPWETNIEKNIISYTSGIGQALEGKKIGEKIKFKNDEYTIKSIKKLEIHE